jgi:hypothetical protein
MRKRHQAILINENAKNKIINELSLFGRTEREQIFKLNNFYEEFIPDNDIEITPKKTQINDPNNKLMQLDDINNNSEFRDDDIDCEESVVISEIKLPTYDESGKICLPKLHFQILNKSDLSDFNFDKSNYIKEKTIIINNSKNTNLSKLSNKVNERIKQKEKEKEKLKEKNKIGEIRHTKTGFGNRKERYLLTEKNKRCTIDTRFNDTEPNNNITKIENTRTLNCGPKLNFQDIIRQIIFWKEESKNKQPNKADAEKNKKKKRGSVNFEAKINFEMILPKVNSFQLFNINPKMIIKIKEKIMKIQKQIKNRDKLAITKKNHINGFLEFQNEIINENNQNITRLANELEKIDGIVYGNNWSIIDLKK